MLTKNEITPLSLSPTKKDFVQIWNELLEVAGKLSERWDPTSTNESDPGIVLLKALTGIADKLHYNIDKNILEAFMPTAAQEESMRKLCDMLGYSMKYYQSATTDVTIKYYNAEPSEEEVARVKENLVIPKFTVVTNSDQDISYFTINSRPYVISLTSPSVTVPCMEGQIVKCESTSSNNIITVNQISENNRFYLPETQIAENGIFVYNIYTSTSGTVEDGTPWKAVTNLNVCPRESRVFKFGFDSYESRPYIEFPEDYSQLFNEGIFIYYTRTNGVNGNVSPGVLTQLELPSSWNGVSAESFSVTNTFSSASTGANKETIKQAYNNFKKTIGTFETLVTCRDYMNKIYMLANEHTNKPYVSNALVTDIRSDLNRALTICSCDDAGIFYKDVPLYKDSTKIVKAKDSKDEFIDVTITTQEPEINHFDLVIYPFKSYSQIKNDVKSIRDPYDASFTYDEASFTTIKNALGDRKTIAHNMVKPRIGDIISINNYLRLNATISTNSKITEEEGTFIIENIKIALANAFNMRELDFGEEIPFDSIVEVIENADSRIRTISLNEPALYTTFTQLTNNANGELTFQEYAVASEHLTAEQAEATGKLTDTYDTDTAKSIYNKLAIRNILAGRVPLFDYNKTFKTSFFESAYQVTKDSTDAIDSTIEELIRKESCVSWVSDDKIYTGKLDEKGKITVKETSEKYTESIVSTVDGTDSPITDIVTECKIEAVNGTISDVKLEQGEYVKFRAPNFTTIKTYPAYVNYHLERSNQSSQFMAIPAKSEILFDLLNSDNNPLAYSTTNNTINWACTWQKALDYFKKIDAQSGTSYVKKFSLSQKISKYSTETKEVSVGTITVNSGTTSETAGLSAAQELLNASGCVKILNRATKLANPTNNGGFFRIIPRLTWDPAETDSIPPGTTGPTDINIDFAVTTPFLSLFESTSLKEISDGIDIAIEKLRSIGKLPTNSAWIISLDFECVPFNAASLNDWAKFIYSTLDWPIVQDSDGTLFWRLYGNGEYNVGKYVNEGGQKLLPFTKNYFSSLGDKPLQAIHVATDLGKSPEYPSIKNEEEYMLTDGEYLYIEYTPSTTTEDGTTKELAAVTEVYGPGTIIRPAGFESGLIDSKSYNAEGHTPHKQMTFSVNGTDVEKSLYSLGVNEQIEIRDFAKVTLDKNSFKFNNNTAAIFTYKNFHNDMLENVYTDDSSGVNVRINNVYTLKDGEYIFYTDQNKSELAYFTSGTQVTLDGSVVLAKKPIVDIAQILDQDISKIPWTYTSLAKDLDKIEFQEYQYRTLGSGDTVQSLKLIAGPGLDSNWRHCKESIAYSTATEESVLLPAVRVPTTNSPADSNGWEACSILGLDVSSNSAQTLRKTSKVSTGLYLLGADSAEITADTKPTIAPEEDKPISFKTNLTCQTAAGSLNIKDVTFNSNNISKFEIKVFAKDSPAIVKTKPEKVIPFNDEDITQWQGEELSAGKDYLEHWTSLGLDRLQKSADEIESFDLALRLPITVPAGTYSIFSIYINDTSKSGETWIEVLPGITKDDISILNRPNKNSWIEGENYKSNKLKLFPGVNCIKVKKTCKIFIKTSQNSSGILYFDDFRLVNYKTLSCEVTENVVDDEGNQVTQTREILLDTQGLNVDQLGYFSVLDDTDESITVAAKRKFKEGYFRTAEELLDTATKTAEQSFSKDCQEIPMLKAKLQTLVSTEQGIVADINRLCAADADLDSTRDLFEQHQALLTEISEAEKLLDIVQNTNIESTAAKLLDLSKQITSMEVDQQKILDSIVTLKENTLKIIDQLTDQELEDAFLMSTGSAGFAYDELISLTAKKIDEDYFSQLDSLTEELGRVLGSEASTGLASLLENYKSDVSADDLKKINIYVRSLANLVSNRETTLNAILESMSDALTLSDFPTLAADLLQLKNFITSADIQFLLTELEKAAGESIDSQLYDLVNRIKAVDLNTIFGDLIVKETDNDKQDTFDDIYNLVLFAINNGLTALSNDVTGAISKIISITHTYYNEQQSTIIGELNTILQTYFSTESKATPEAKQISAVVSQLDQVKSRQVAKVLSRLCTLSSTYESFYEKFANLTKGALATAQAWLYDDYIGAFVKEAVHELWPKFLKAAVVSRLDKTQEGIKKLLQLQKISIKSGAADASITTVDEIADEIAALKACLGIVDTGSIGGNDKVLKVCLYLFIDYNSYKSIVTATELATKKQLQNRAQSDLLASLSKTGLYVPVSADGDGTDFISQIITKINNSENTLSVLEKQRLISLFVSELKNSIESKIDLAQTILKTIYPSVFQFQASELITDPFFSKLSNAISADEIGLVYTLKNPKDGFKLSDLSNSWTASLEDDSAYLALFDNYDNEELFAQKLKDFSSESANSLLPDTFTSFVTGLKTSLDIQAGVTTVKGTSADNWTGLTGLHKKVQNILTGLKNSLKSLDAKTVIESREEASLNLVFLEDQLLTDIRKLDINHEFYYNVPIESSLAIDFTTSVDSLKNPLINYDINNVNNNFVISKLDIDYLTNGIKIARSSRLN